MIFSITIIVEIFITTIKIIVFYTFINNLSSFEIILNFINSCIHEIFIKD